MPQNTSWRNCQPADRSLNVKIDDAAAYCLHPAFDNEILGRMTGLGRSNSLESELYGLLLQDIARGTVMIFESLRANSETPGKAGAIFTHD
jgi:hypothetical protein